MFDPRRKKRGGLAPLPPALARPWQVRWQVAMALNRLPKPKTENAWQVWQLIPIVIPTRLTFSLFFLFSILLCDSFEKRCHTCHCGLYTA
jgi:hypothetical protein